MIQDCRRLVLSKTSTMAVLILFSLLVPAIACAYPMPLTDEATSDASLVSFRKQLLQAVARKDAGYIKSVLSPNVLPALGGGKGIPDFLGTWKPMDKHSQF